MMAYAKVFIVLTQMVQRLRTCAARSIPLPDPSVIIEARGAFFWSGGERGLGENPWFDKLRSSLDRKMLRAFSACGTSLCLTAAGARAAGRNAGATAFRVYPEKTPP